MRNFDITFNMRTDVKEGQDPDAYSKKLKEYHLLLWHRPLPNGDYFKLTKGTARFIEYKSNQGTLYLASDVIGSSYVKYNAMQALLTKIPQEEKDAFYNLCSTIGSYIIYPAKQVKGGLTIKSKTDLT